MSPLLTSNLVFLLDNTEEASLWHAYHLKIIVMLLIFLVSLFAVSFPALSTRLTFLRIPRILFFVGKHFGTGVILSTAFVHLLQDAFESLLDPGVSERWPMMGKWAGSIILSSLLSIFLIEYISTSYVDHLHAHPSAPSSPCISRALSPTNDTDMDERTPLFSQEPNKFSSSPSASMPHTYSSQLPLTMEPHSKSITSDPSHTTPNTHAPPHFFPNHHRHEPRSHHRDHPPGLKARGRKASEHVVSGRRPRRHQMGDGEESGVRSRDGDSGGEGCDDGTEGEVKVGRKRQIVGILVLQLGIMIHSLVIGITLAVTTGAEFKSLVTAITFHQLFEGLSLGIRIAALPAATTSSRHGMDVEQDNDTSRKGRGGRLLEVILALLFAVTTPVGIAVGLGVFEGTGAGADEVQMKLTQGIMSAISAGMLIYASCVEMLAADFVMAGSSGEGAGVAGGWGKVIAVWSLGMGVLGMSLVD